MRQELAMDPLSFLSILSTFNNTNQGVSTVPVELAFESYNIVPDLISTVPQNFITVSYSSRLQAILGNLLTLDQVSQEPISVQFYCCPERYYSLIMLDPDVPSRNDTSLSPLLHWNVGNIPASNVSAGETLAVYSPPQPDAGTGPHRYVLLVFRQKEKLHFTESRILSPDIAGRPKFALAKYIKKYDLVLISGNFFQAERGNNGCRQGLVPISKF